MLKINKIFGREIINDKTILQLENCLIEGSIGVLTADAHYGYSMPVGGCVAYENHISLSGVGFDIGCGNKAVKTNIKYNQIDLLKILPEIIANISFGIGRQNPNPINHPVLDKIANSQFLPQRRLLDLANNQLGTVGSGNHYVDIFKDEEDYIWVGVHFGSRGFGHKTTTSFISLSKGVSFTDLVADAPMDAKPILFDMNTYIGQDYFYAMGLAGEYAYAGRDRVCQKVVDILGGQITYEVHNHHNFARQEKHFDKNYRVVRKGCTPAFPGQQGFIGANMLDQSVIVEGVEGTESKNGLYSTVHGAGRILSRTQAAGKTKWQNGKKIQTSKGLVNFDNTKIIMKKNNILLCGGGADESPECYKILTDVLSYHGDTIKILQKLTPILVIMAGENEFDPYKD